MIRQTKKSGMATDARGVETPSARQARASDPLKSVWVGASAGTGKTKVLIDRVLRLMLPRVGMAAKSATAPERILCLTFTKTAAAEMSNRIYQRLADWAVMDDAALVSALEKLLGGIPAGETVQEARRLFARVLDAPGGLKIMTIHSFCQSVLKRFPLEAGLAPHFTLMDENGALEYLTAALHDLIAETRKHPDSDLAAAFSHLALVMNQEDMSDKMREMMSRRSLLQAILQTHGDNGGAATQTLSAIRAKLGLAPDDTAERVHADIAENGNDADLRRALAALLQGSTNDLKIAKGLEPWLAALPSERAGLFKAYKISLLTDKGKVRSDLGTQKVQKILPDTFDILSKEARRILDLDQKLIALDQFKANESLIRIAAALVGRYETHKKNRDCLDYEDLIFKTCDLLSSPQMVQWVLFKLDQGIDHILVDEAQDTSPYQWRVIRALADEFFAGMGARDEVLRTLFVVGDEKQSIFSFQGADPYEFARMRDYFGERVLQAQDSWDVNLEYSFRSTRSVLQTVDRIFAQDHVRQGVVFDAERSVSHVPVRDLQAGLVELWPLFETADQGEGDPWSPPLSVEQADNAAGDLAAKVAATIRGWLDSGEMLPSKARAIRPGDILILVQSRGAFVEQLMRALNAARIPVAGIDRIVLTEEIAVMDLLAAASFALQPRDDLMLATLLKSPLIGLGEEELFHLCFDRTLPLFAVLGDKRPDIAAYLTPLIQSAGKVTPYEFFAGLLSSPAIADARSGRRAIYGRLGLDAADALDEFLNSCLAFEQTHTPSLQGFVDWFMQGEAEIKREQEGGRAKLVRIMTVHASKGLQAPIVFMPDTVKIMHDHNKGRARLLWPEDETGVPLWSPRKDLDTDIYARLQKEAQARQEEEYRRLLYVALTRAEDRLYIAGYKGRRNKINPKCWYSLVESAFPADAARVSFDATRHILRYSHPQEGAAEAVAEETVTATVGKAVLPDWIFAAPAAEPSPSLPLAPSRPGEDEPAVKSPLERKDDWKFRRGIIVHQILEVLPRLPQERRLAALQNYLSRPHLNIDETDRPRFIEEVLAVIHHPDFAPIFSPAAQAEVPVVGISGTQVLSGQMDRVLVTDREVLIVDYKTNRPPPTAVGDVPVVYLKQMASYVSVMRKIYPDRPVRAALLWTDIPLLMPLPPEMLEIYIKN